MPSLARSLALFALLFSSLISQAEESNILYLGPISPSDLSIRDIVSDYQAGTLKPFLYDWRLSNGKIFPWKRCDYHINPDKGNDQRIVFPECKSLRKGDAIVFRMTMRNDQQQHLRYLGDTKGIKRIILDGKEILHYHGKLPAGEYELLLIYIHKNDNQKGIPFTVASALSGKLLPKCKFILPEVRGIIDLPVQRSGTVEFAVNNGVRGDNKPCRLYVYNDKHEPQFDDSCPDCFETFTCNGSAKLILPLGKYTYAIESGKEYGIAEGQFEIIQGEVIRVSRELHRFCDVNSEGWYAGDLHNHTTIERTPLLMESENIHVTYVPWWWINPPMGRTSKKTLLGYPSLLKLKNNRYINTRAGEDERWDATLMFFGMPEEIEIPNATWSSPPSVHFAKKYGVLENVWVHLDHMFWWQTPAILASGEINSLEVLNNNLVHGGVNDTEAWGKPRNKEKYPPPYGNAQYQQDVYFKVLNCGLRIPPAAGSAACVGGGPFGYNRVYTHVEGDLTYEKWWQALQKGECFITNGPLLRVSANGQLPGHVFQSNEKMSVSVDMKLDAREKITEIQVIKNGVVSASIAYRDWKDTGKIPEVEFKRSGWFLIRVLTNNPGTYRTALTGPYYIEIGNTPSTIHPQDVQFFLDWAREAARKNIASTPEERALFDKYSTDSIRFWEELLAQSSSNN